MKTVAVKVIGKVQGVYFRASAKQHAIGLGIYGYVRNEPDGSVSLVIEGKSEAVESMIKWCKKGPVFARVSEVIVVDHINKNYISFDIER